MWTLAVPLEVLKLGEEGRDMFVVDTVEGEEEGVEAAELAADGGCSSDELWLGKVDASWNRSCGAFFAMFVSDAGTSAAEKGILYGGESFCWKASRCTEGENSWLQTGSVSSSSSESPSTVLFSLL